MAFETEPPKNQEPAGSPITTTSANNDVIEDTVVPQNRTLKDYGLQIMERLASTRFGQYVTEKADGYLKILEQTAKWGLPQNDPEFELERPLPWIIFLYLILGLRILRTCLSICSSIIGYQAVTARSVVNFIQNKRRDVRALRVHGLKEIQKRELDNQAIVMSGRNISIIGKLKNLLSNVICTSGRNCETSSTHVLAEVEMDQHTKEKTEQPSTSKRPRDEDSSDLNLTVKELLEKYAKVDSESDSDYVPKEEDEENYYIDENDDSIISSLSTEEVTLEENPEISSEATNDAEESASKDTEIKTAEIKDKEIKDKKIEDTKNKEAEIKDAENNYVEIQTNGDSKQQEKSEKEPLSNAETGNEQMLSPKEIPAHENGSPQPTEQINNGASESNAASTSEVASKNLSSILKTNLPKHLAVPLDGEDQRKSTPGHESAASVKLSFVDSGNKNETLKSDKEIMEEKCYRTITTQTSLEIDWSITIKTEITHHSSRPKLENLKYSVQLTPATSEEDIFYSPIGSPQDFPSNFYPSTLGKDSADGAQAATPKIAERSDDGTSPDLDVTGSASKRKKYLSSNSNIHKANHPYQNTKRRNRNRR